jgi:hypothetical protein
MSSTPSAPAAPPAPAPGTAVPSPGLRDFDPADGKGRAAIVSVGIVALIALVRGPWLLQRGASGGAILESSPSLAGISSFYSFAIIGSIIAVIVWFKGAYDNAAPLGASSLRYMPGWAVGAWFIPVGNLFIPKQIADDLWRSSDPSLPADAGAHWKFRPVPGVLHLWWAAWLGRSVLTVASEVMASTAIEEGDLSSYRTASTIGGIGDLAMVVAGAMLIKIIVDVTARQRERARVLSEGSAAPAPAPQASPAE